MSKSLGVNKGSRHDDNYDMEKGGAGAVNAAARGASLFSRSKKSKAEKEKKRLKTLTAQEREEEARVARSRQLELDQAFRKAIRDDAYESGRLIGSLGKNQHEVLADFMQKADKINKRYKPLENEKILRSDMIAYEEEKQQLLAEYKQIGEFQKFMQEGGWTDENVWDATIASFGETSKDKSVDRMNREIKKLYFEMGKKAEEIQFTPKYIALKEEMESGSAERRTKARESLQKLLAEDEVIKNDPAARQQLMKVLKQKQNNIVETESNRKYAGEIIGVLQTMTGGMK